VPLLEAFYKQIPVVAFAAGAVEETMNGGGIVVQEKDFLKIAATLDRLMTDRGFREQVVTSQSEALGKYDRENISRILLQHIGKVSQR
jgi:glycosyltransferase involved in cell wall biosynthesis